MYRIAEQDGHVYAIVNGEELLPISEPYGDPGFPEYFWQHKAENEYVSLLRISLPYFEDLKNGIIKLDDESYLIKVPKTEDRTEHLQPWFVHVKKSVKVRKQPNGRFDFCGSDGRHRYEAARRNLMDILVEVVQ